MCKIIVLSLLFQPEWKLADPACTFLFSILVLFSTVNILRDAVLVLMEGEWCARASSRPTYM